MTIRVGVDVGGTKILAVVMRDDTVLATHTLPTRVGPEGLVESMIRCVNAVMAAAKVSPSRLDGIGLGVPGVVDADAGTVAHAVNLGLDGTPLQVRSLLAARYGCTVNVEKDVAAAALGAWHAFGAAHDLALLGLGTGLAAGLVLDGRIRRGASGIAGEVGHLGDVAGGPTCGCGQAGCLNMLASGSALQRSWARGRMDASPESFTRALAAGDPAAVLCLHDAAAWIARACRILTLTIDPEIIALGGGLSSIGKRLLDEVRSALDEDARRSPLLESLRIGERIHLAPEPHLIGALGAARLV